MGVDIVSRIRIADAALMLGVSPSALRRWEAAGLVAPHRIGRYRYYGQEDIESLRKIKALRSEGVGVNAIRNLFAVQSPAPAQDGTEENGNGAGQRALGLRMRDLRLREGLRLRDLAEQSGVSVSHISAIERGATNASVGSLHRLTAALGVSVSSLFDENSRPPTPLVRADERPTLTTGEDEVNIEALTIGSTLLESHRYVVKPGGGSEGSYSHNGEEFIYVEQGAARFWLGEGDGDEHLVEVGSSLTFPSTVQHRWENAGEDDLVMLWVCTPITL